MKDGDSLFAITFAVILLCGLAWVVVNAYFNAKLDYQKKVMRELDQQDRKSKP